MDCRSAWHMTTCSFSAAALEASSLARASWDCTLRMTSLSTGSQFVQVLIRLADGGFQIG